MRLTESGIAGSKQLLCDAYRVTNQLRVATRRALEWIRMFECPADFFDMKHHTCLLDIVLN